MTYFKIKFRRKPRSSDSFDEGTIGGWEASFGTNQSMEQYPVPTETHAITPHRIYNANVDAFSYFPHWGANA